jgi:hypothetical protein
LEDTIEFFKLYTHTEAWEREKNGRRKRINYCQTAAQMTKHATLKDALPPSTSGEQVIDLFWPPDVPSRTTRMAQRVMTRLYVYGTRRPTLLIY